MRDSFDLVMKMGDERARPFLKLQKLFQSPTFREALLFATDHYNTHGDSRFIAELCGLYGRTNARRLLIGHVRTHAGLDVSIENGQVRLAKVTEVSAAAAAPKQAKKTAPVVEVTVKKRKKPKRVDLMAPWIRMPGHYGAKGR